MWAEQNGVALREREPHSSTQATCLTAHVWVFTQEQVYLLCYHSSTSYHLKTQALCYQPIKNMIYNFSKSWIFSSSQTAETHSDALNSK